MILEPLAVTLETLQEEENCYYGKFMYLVNPYQYIIYHILLIIILSGTCYLY